MIEMPSPHLTRSIVRVVGSAAGAVVGCLVVLAGFAWHYSNAWAAHLSCPDVRLGEAGQLSPGGWNNPPWCTYPNGESIVPSAGEFSILRPMWSAVAFGLIAIVSVVSVAMVLRALRHWSSAAAAPSMNPGGSLDRHTSVPSSEVRA